MTTPPEQPTSVVQWQVQLLTRIRLLASQHARIEGAGWEGFEPLDSGGNAEAAWREHLDGLTAERHLVEQTALTAGLSKSWIADAVALGEHDTGNHPRLEALSRADSMPWRDNAAQEFYMDMLALDLWHLERMAALSAERTDRIETGRWTSGSNPTSEQVFAKNMGLRHERVVALAHAAQITSAEASMLWSDAAEGARRDHAVRLVNRDELSVAREWHSYTKPSTELSVPPYVPTDPDTGIPIAGAQALPPTPQQMISAARASLRAEFIDAALAGVDGDVIDTTATITAISAAVDTEPSSGAPAAEVGDPGAPDADIGGYHHDIGTDP